MIDYPIRCIVETVSSERDRNGNCYHFAVFYCPAKGRHLRVAMETGGPSNASHHAMRVLGNWESILTFERSLPKREWQRQRANFTTLLYEGSEEAKAALGGLLAD